MKQKLNKKHIFLALGLFWLAQFFGAINIHLGISQKQSLIDFGEISSGSLTSSSPHIVIDWGNRKIFHSGDEGQLTVKIVEFNQWDWALWIPLFKYYVPQVRGEVVDEKGKKLGDIALSDKFQFIGIYGRGGIIKHIQEIYTEAIIKYLQNRSAPNHDRASDSIGCQDQMGFSPFGDFPEIEYLLRDSPKRTYYCLQRGQQQWHDTIRVLPSLSGTSPMFETCFFNRSQNLMKQTRYLEEGIILFEAIYEAKHTRQNNRSYFLKERTVDEQGYSGSFAELKRLTLYGLEGDTILPMSKSTRIYFK